MSLTLDAEPIVLDEALDFSPECYYMTCGADSAWVARWRCGCVTTYCETHKVVIAREVVIVCEECHAAPDNIAPAQWSML